MNNTLREFRIKGQPTKARFEATNGKTFFLKVYWNPDSGEIHFRTIKKPPTENQ
jgi:hypothetical protein